MTTYPFYVPSSGGPIRARDPRCPWQGLVSRPRGVGGSGAEERGFPGTPRAVRSQPASSDLEGSRGTELAELPDGFLPRQDELASHGSF